MIGATNVGVIEFAPDNNTVVPETCVQAYEIMVAWVWTPFKMEIEPVEPVPFSVTEAPEDTACDTPAFAIGRLIIVGIVWNGVVGIKGKKAVVIVVVELLVERLSVAAVVVAVDIAENLD